MSPHAIDVGNRKQLFIDGRFIAESGGVELHVNPPALRGPVFEGERPWEAGYMLFATVLQEGDVLRMWYFSCAPGKEGQLGPSYFCYATSRDGVHWERPALGLVEYEGSKKTNILASGEELPLEYVFLDPKAPVEQRYKGLWFKSPADEGGLYIACSPDGISWRKHPQRLLPLRPDTQNQVLYDPSRDKYLAYVRADVPLEGRSVGAAFRKVGCAVIDDPLAPWPYEESVELNCEFWGEELCPPPGREFPYAMSYDEFDPPNTDLYNPAVSIYPWAESVYVGFPSAYYHFPEPPEGEYSNDGLLEAQLAVSRDGLRFERPGRGRAYIPLGVSESIQAGQIYVYPHLVRFGDEIHQYYSAHALSHGRYSGVGETRGNGRYCLAVQRLDGFMSADAAYTGGWLVTPPISFSGCELELNIDCKATGHAVVELRDEHDLPIKGFAAADCDLIRGNHIHYTVTWQGDGDVSALAGRPLRMKFVMRNARLFAFEFRD